MFQDLKIIVDLFRSAISGARKFHDEKARDESLLSMLKLYFLLKDCVDDGQTMLAEAGTNPLETIQAMETRSGRSTLERWKVTITKQGIRLRMLNSLIFDQPHLTVLDPSLQDKISDVIGSKMDSVVTLHGIGAALLFRGMFRLDDTVEEQINYVLLLAGADHGDANIDVAKMAADIAAFRESLDAYRTVIERLIPDADILKLSRRARQETTFSERLERS